MTMLKPLRKIAEESIAFPVTADEVLEFHAARLILLFRNCGIGGRIDGLTKMAKLDFFVRYPVFFARLDTTAPEGLKNRVESSMIRFHYGPWDPRYYRVLTYLEAKGLIGVTKSGRGYQFELSPLGKDVSDELANRPEFRNMVAQMKSVKKLLGDKSGSALKQMIYKRFSQEVTDRRLGEVIE